MNGDGHHVGAVPATISTRSLTKSTRDCHGADRAWSIIVPEDFSALHHKFHVLRLADIGQRIARNGDDVGELTLRNGPDIVPPSHFRCGVDGSSLQGGCGSHAPNFDQRCKLERVRALTPFGALGPAPEDRYDSLGGDAHPGILLKNG